MRVFFRLFILKRSSRLSRPRCAMKMAIDKVILSLPLEFRGKDPVSVCEVCWLYDRSLIQHRLCVATWRWL